LRGTELWREQPFPTSLCLNMIARMDSRRDALHL
jgi:hypothetical protein